MERRSVVGVLLGLAALAACKGGDPLPDAASIEAASGAAGLTGPAGARLAAPLAVIVRSDDGGTVTRAAVLWTVTSGAGAALSDTLTLSDGNGRAEVSFTFGPNPGVYRVEASLRDSPDASVLLTATATDPPILTAVQPTTFTGGDTLMLTGTGLSVPAAPEVGGAPARLLAATATSMSLLAPICLVPGPVQIRVGIGTATTNTLTATFEADTLPLALEPGDYASIDPLQLAGCATFPVAGAAGAEYLLAPQAVTGSPGATAQYRLAGDSVVVSLAAPSTVAAQLPRAVRFHDALREQEREAAQRPRAPTSAFSLSSGASLARIELGDQRSFQVCGTLPCSGADNFETVTGDAMYVGNHAAVFLDQSAPAGFAQTDFDSLGLIFDEELYDVDTRAFGAESDVDQNGVVIILFTPTVNKLTPKADCETSVITGYFFGVDIDPLFQNDPRSNMGEVFYALAPDPDGTVTCDLSTQAVRRLVPITFVHEFQHMISYHQHVIVRGGFSEVLWLNEAMSHLAEELAARRFEALGNQTLFSQFAIGDVYNANLFLQNPGAVHVFPNQGTGSLEERGAAWLFVRWLVDQFGDDLSRRLVETRLLGADNVAGATGEPVSKLLSQWFLANYVSDLDGFDPPTRLTYDSWRFRTTFLSLHQDAPTRFPRPFPLVPVEVDAGTFEFSGTLRSGSGDYLRVLQQPNGRGFTVLMAAPAGGPVSASVVPRLNVIRIK